MTKYWSAICILTQIEEIPICNAAELMFTRAKTVPHALYESNVSFKLRNQCLNHSNTLLIAIYFVNDFGILLRVILAPIKSRAHQHQDSKPSRMILQKFYLL